GRPRERPSRWCGGRTRGVWEPDFGGGADERGDGVGVGELAIGRKDDALMPVTRRRPSWWFLVASLATLVGAATGFGEQRGVWWEKRAPSIEEISGGRLHAGDKITKENVAWVKDYMPEGFY